MVTQAYSTNDDTTDANMNVTALVDPSGNVVERTTYDAYGKPTFYAGNSFATASAASGYNNEVLFAGYRHDALLGIYIVRHRVYDPITGRWIQRDPEGDIDGPNLYQYVGGNPIHYVDPTGLWKIVRNNQAKADAIAEKDDTMKTLAEAIGLNVDEWKRWVTPQGATIKTATGVKPVYAVDEDDIICPGTIVKVPNTVIAFWAGAGDGFGKWWVRWGSDVATLKKRGFKVSEKEFVPISVEKNSIVYEYIAAPREAEFLGWFQTGTADKTLHGIFFWGHGGFSLWTDPSNPLVAGTYALGADKLQNALQYEMGLGVMWACSMMEYYGAKTEDAWKDGKVTPKKRGDFTPKKGIFAPKAIVEGGWETLYPHGFHLYGDSMDKIIPPGAQGTKK